MGTEVKKCGSSSRSGAGWGTGTAEIWERWLGERDLEAREALAARYVGLVEMITRRVARATSIHLRDDLYGFGVIGLLDALDKFRPEYGCPFEGYASIRIEGSIRDGIRTMSPLPRGSSNRTDARIKGVIPVDFQTALSSDGHPLQDCVADEGEPSAIELLELDAERDEVRLALRHLPHKEQTVLIAYYYEARYLRDIGIELGLTESRICQLHRRGLRLLRESLLRLQTA